jgi:hypothetical protein
MATYKQPTKVANVIVGEEPAKETMRKANVSVANTRSQDYPPMKTSGIVVRGGKAQTKGKMAEAQWHESVRFHLRSHKYCYW